MQRILDAITPGRLHAHRVAARWAVALVSVPAAVLLSGFVYGITGGGSAPPSRPSTWP